MAGASADFSSPKRILDARHLRPRKRFGQNFLTDPRVAERIAQALPGESYVLEIGAGTGALTAALLQQARFVTTLEIDRDLAAVVHERFPQSSDRLRIINEDVLHYNLHADLQSQAPPRAVCGNLPYYITTPILERIFESSDAWESAVLMVQREYARRLLAKPGGSDYSSLTLFAAHFVRVEKLFEVGAAGFFPAPEVASAVIRLIPTRRAFTADRQARLLWLIRTAFRHRRKTLVNSVLEAHPGERATVRKGLEAALATIGHATTIRGERLTLADFYALADTLVEQGLMENLWTTQPSTSR